MIIRQLTASDAKAVSRIHRESIAAGFISGLPARFTEVLYEEISKSKHAFGLVAEDDFKILGFICCVLDVKKLFRHLLLRKGVLLALPLIRYFFDLGVIKKLINNVFYSSKFAEDLPRAEILSVAISDEARGRGVGKALMENAIEKFKVRGIYRVKALTDSQNNASNAYYQKCGFALFDKVKRHKNYSNVYVLGFKG